MLLFKVNINHNYKDLLLQHLSQLNLVHIKTKPEIRDIIEKDKVLFERIKKLSQNLETLFKDLNITEFDFQKLIFEKEERKEFDAKDIDDLLNQI